MLFSSLGKSIPEWERFACCVNWFTGAYCTGAVNWSEDSISSKRLTTAKYKEEPLVSARSNTVAASYVEELNVIITIVRL